MMLALLFRVATANLLGFSEKYVVDVSSLTDRQRNIVQEIITLYNFQNEMIIEALDPKSRGDVTTMTYASDLDNEEFIERLKEKKER